MLGTNDIGLDIVLAKQARSQKPSRPASKATQTRRTTRPARRDSSRQRSINLSSFSGSGASFFSGSRARPGARAATSRTDLLDFDDDDQRAILGLGRRETCSDRQAWAWSAPSWESQRRWCTILAVRPIASLPAKRRGEGMASRGLCGRARRLTIVPPFPPTGDNARSARGPAGGVWPRPAPARSNRPDRRGERSET